MESILSVYREFGRESDFSRHRGPLLCCPLGWTFHALAASPDARHARLPLDPPDAATRRLSNANLADPGARSLLSQLMRMEIVALRLSGRMEVFSGRGSLGAGPLPDELVKVAFSMQSRSVKDVGPGQVEAVRKRVDLFHRACEKARRTLWIQAAGFHEDASESGVNAFDDVSAFVVRDGTVFIVRSGMDPELDAMLLEWANEELALRSRIRTLLGE